MEIRVWDPLLPLFPRERVKSNGRPRSPVPVHGNPFRIRKGLPQDLQALTSPRMYQSPSHQHLQSPSNKALTKPLTL